jgi:hypothetical protein
MQLYMIEGRRGQYDEKILVFPRAPMFSKDGCAFLGMLSEVTFRRLKMSLSAAAKKKGMWWELMRLRAPDAGRILWAIGKIKWRDKRVFKYAGQVCKEDMMCPWNRPRYMTTAMWGAAWAYPSTPMLPLASAVEHVPTAFWKGASFFTELVLQGLSGCLCWLLLCCRGILYPRAFNYPRA